MRFAIVVMLAKQLNRFVGLREKLVHLLLEGERITNPGRLHGLAQRYARQRVQYSSIMRRLQGWRCPPACSSVRTDHPHPGNRWSPPGLGLPVPKRIVRLIGVTGSAPGEAG